MFSLHPVKAIAMGEGGVVTTNSSVIHERLMRFRNHGLVRDSARFVFNEQAFDENGEPYPWYYEMPEIGWNYRASDVQCALGLSQLSKLPRFVEKRAQLLTHYHRRLRDVNPYVQPLEVCANGRPAWHLAVVLIDYEALNTTRAKVVHSLQKMGVGTQVHYVPVHLQPYYRHRYAVPELPGASRYYERCLSLPLFPAMESDDVDYVVDSLLRATGL